MHHMKNITIATNDGVDHVMTAEHYTRWLCLVEAMDVIHNAAERNNINLNKRNDWVKPLAIQKYMDERFHSMLHDVKVEEGLYTGAIQVFVDNTDEYHTDLLTEDHDSENLEALDMPLSLH